MVAFFVVGIFFIFCEPSAHAEGIMADLVDKSMKGLIQAVFVFFGWLLAVSAVLMGWVCDAGRFQAFMNNASVLAVWYLVRDVLNICFIFVLLTSAFGTIFQVSSWNIKRIWLNVLINALLVNFSYSIARFLIDISNVIMYYFLNSFFSGMTKNGAGSIFTKFGESSGIAGILYPKTGSFADFKVSYMIAATIFVFILAMTLLVIAGMFLVRLIALTIIVMFSPIGFVGNIFPGSNTLKQYADKWWKNLFSYAFMGPIMLFMMMISIKMMQAMGESGGQMSGFLQSANQETPNGGDPGFIGSLAMFMVPVFVLWIGITSAASASKEVGDWAKKVGGWGKKFQNTVTGLPGKGWRATGIPGGIKKGWGETRKSGKIFGFDNKATKFLLKDNYADREGKWTARFEGGRAGVKKYKDKKKSAKNREDIKEKAEEHATMDRRELVNKVRTAQLGGVEKDGVKRRDNAVDNAGAAQELLRMKEAALNEMLISEFEEQLQDRDLSQPQRDQMIRERAETIRRRKKEIQDHARSVIRDAEKQETSDYAAPGPLPPPPTQEQAAANPPAPSPTPPPGPSAPQGGAPANTGGNAPAPSREGLTERGTEGATQIADSEYIPPSGPSNAGRIV